MVARRSLIAGGAAVGALTWVAPSVVTLDRVAAAMGSGLAETPVASNGAIIIPPPLVNAEGTPALDSNSNTYVWQEVEGEVLDNNLTVNRTTAGTFGGNSNQNATIAAGTEICSWFVHGDRLDDSGTLTGTITFGSAQILGLIYRNSQMNSSAYLENPSTTYSRGPMENSDIMTLNLTPGANSLTWSMQFGPALDGIRVITTCPN